MNGNKLEFKLEEKKKSYVEQLTKKIAATNKEFALMTKAEQRVFIANDVIAQIKAKKFRARNGTYLELNGTDTDNLETVDKLLENIPSCDVCAVGSLFMSMASKTKAEIAPLVKASNEAEGRCQEECCQSSPSGDVTLDNLDSDVMRNELKKYFSHSQLDLMESAFELDEFLTEESSNANRRKGVDNAIEFGESFDYSEDRLLAIMQNVVDNKGMFLPPKMEKKED